LLIRAEDLIKDYYRGVFRLPVRAVDGVSFTVGEGEVFGLVGESGSGKSTVARLLLLLQKPTEGRVSFDGIELTALRGSQLRRFRPQMQIIFQNPRESLNPRVKIYDALAEPLRLYGLARSRAQEREEIYRLMFSVGLAEEHLNRYPHQLSGGQAQRVAIARALALKPRFIVADEPTSMLDVSVQAQILRLMMELRETYGIAIMLISHDLEVIRAVCDRVAVMHRGKIVETGKAQQVLAQPAHNYTRELVEGSLFLHSLPELSAAVGGWSSCDPMQTIRRG